jgi:hypothetical protein
MSEIATEAGHWYTLDGEPAYEVPNKSKPGKMRPVTLADARKLNLVPSVTTIIKCADAPALTSYKVQQALLAGAATPRDPLEGDQAWMDRVFAKSKEHSETARDIGSIIHGCIELCLTQRAYNPDYAPHVNGAIEALGDWCCGIDGLRPERSFCHPAGYGGKCDVHKNPAIEIDMVHSGFVADFKTKDFTNANLPLTYENHAMQLAAYREGFSLPSAKCAIIYVSTSVPGLVHLVEVGEDELVRGWEMFRALLTYWQFKNRYAPSFEELAA